MNPYALCCTSVLCFSFLCVSPNVSKADEVDSGVKGTSAEKLYEQASIRVMKSNPKNAKNGGHNDKGNNYLSLLEAAAKQGHVKALLELASFYELGLAGLTKNHVKAAQYYGKAVKLGSDDARFNLALLLTTSDVYSGGGNLVKARTLITPLAMEGDAEAQYTLSLMFKEKNAITFIDPVSSFYWLSLAADAGYANAEFNLGLHYLKGEMVEKNLAKAFNWFSKSANNGQGRAQFNLALMYEKGLGVSANPERSLHWYQSAAELGNANAQQNLGIKYLLGDGLKKDEDKAIALITKAAKQQHKDAQFLLARIYQKGGKNIEADLNEAERLYSLSAKQGHNGAEQQLAMMNSGDKSSQLDAKYLDQEAITGRN